MMARPGLAPTSWSVSQYPSMPEQRSVLPSPLSSGLLALTQNPTPESGEEGGVVFYSVRGKEGTLFEFLDDDLHVVGTLSMQDYINAFKAQQNA